MNPGEQLCLDCGLCCDGTLFDNVQLGATDAAEKLRTLGLPLVAAGSKGAVTLFRQPCAALCADRSCRVYGDRPTQCRAFECGVFKDVQAGRMELPRAQRLVRKTRRKADDVRRLLEKLGDTQVHVSLNERYRRTQRRLEAAGAPSADASIFAELTLAMHQLGLLAQAKFHTPADRA